MSRNFELLRRAGIDTEAAVVDRTSTLNAAAGVSPAPIVIPADAESRIPQEAIGPETFSLVEKLFFGPNESAPRCVMFVSFGSSGASVCARAAEALSRCQSGSVAVVDAHFNAPSVHALYAIDNGVGFSDSLVKTQPVESYAHRVPGSNLTIIPAGSALRARGFSPAREPLQRVLTDLRSTFDYVLIDAPAELLTSGALMLAHQSDGAVLVIEAEETRREMARHAVEELTSSGVRILGTVLNNRRFPIPQRLYQAL